MAIWVENGGKGGGIIVRRVKLRQGVELHQGQLEPENGREVPRKYVKCKISRLPTGSCSSWRTWSGG